MNLRGVNFKYSNMLRLPYHKFTHTNDVKVYLNDCTKTHTYCNTYCQNINFLVATDCIKIFSQKVSLVEWDSLLSHMV